MVRATRSLQQQTKNTHPPAGDAERPSDRLDSLRAPSSSPRGECVGELVATPNSALSRLLGRSLGASLALASASAATLAAAASSSALVRVRMDWSLTDVGYAGLHVSELAVCLVAMGASGASGDFDSCKIKAPWAAWAAAHRPSCVRARAPRCVRVVAGVA